MSWPSPGDPYYTVEGGQRRTFYAVNTVPRLVMNGVTQNNPIGFTQAEFDESVNLYSFVNLSADYSVGGQTVDINVQIDPVVDGNGVWNNLVLHAAIFEYTTFNNASSNGEFEFYNIMKKMSKCVKHMKIYVKRDDVFENNGRGRQSQRYGRFNKFLLT